MNERKTLFNEVMIKIDKNYMVQFYNIFGIYAVDDGLKFKK